MTREPEEGLPAGWYEALERRHLAELTFSEVRRALQALSSLYVERRGEIGRRDPLGSAGKRAAYALFYGPLHLLLVRGIVRQLGAATPAPASILDLGCGTGAAGAGWALEAGGRSTVTGVDRNAWALAEARRAWDDLGVRGTSRRASIETIHPRPGMDVVAAFSVNELDGTIRDRLRETLLAAAARGSRVLVIEPLARRAAPWWTAWAAEFRQAGGRADEWRLRAELPERLRLLDRAAGLDHRELTGRSLFLPGAGAPPERRPAHRDRS